MQSRSFFLLAALGGAATFAAALYFQYVEGLAPCKLCIWQRYGLAVGIAGALVAAMTAGRAGRVTFGAIGAMGFLAEAAVAMFHTGVERKWWPGPSTCSGGSLPTVFDPAALQAAAERGKPVPQCDEIVWDFLGLSMANWNVAIALGFMVLCMIGVGRVKRSA
jgi:disulfide bond formation protein DsbB